ncbi:hypothetical protein ABPG75_000162 [Micractinium tetrahymenae]
MGPGTAELEAAVLALLRDPGFRQRSGPCLEALLNAPLAAAESGALQVFTALRRLAVSHQRLEFTALHQMELGSLPPSLQQLEVAVIGGHALGEDWAWPHGLESLTLSGTGPAPFGGIAAYPIPPGEGEQDVWSTLRALHISGALSVMSLDMPEALASCRQIRFSGDTVRLLLASDQVAAVMLAQVLGASPLLQVALAMVRFMDAAPELACIEVEAGQLECLNPADGDEEGDEGAPGGHPAVQLLAGELAPGYFAESSFGGCTGRLSRPAAGQGGSPRFLLRLRQQD